MEVTVKVKSIDANEMITHLESINNIDKTRKIIEENNFVYIPLKTKNEPDIDIKYFFSKKELPKRKEKKKFKDVVCEFLTEDEVEKLKTSYDIVGDLAIIEIDEDLRKKEKKIAQALLETNNLIKGVFRKDGAHHGKFRTQKMKFLAGENRLETLHKENRIKLKLNIQEVYFSARQSTERKRISQKVRDGEKVLVLFSGCAPFPCTIAKNSNPIIVCGVEMNPIGHQFGQENIKLNKLNNVFLSNNDARDFEKINNDFKDLEHYTKRFDRIIMPHPSDSENFLEHALKFAQKNTYFHFYTFSDEDKIKEKEKEIIEICNSKNFNVKIIETVLCGQHSPAHYRICVDFMIE